MDRHERLAALRRDDRQWRRHCGRECGDKGCRPLFNRRGSACPPCEVQVRSGNDRGAGTNCLVGLAIAQDRGGPAAAHVFGSEGFHRTVWGGVSAAMSELTKVAEGRVGDGRAMPRPMETQVTSTRIIQGLDDLDELSDGWERLATQ